MQNCGQLSLLYLPCYETMGLPSSFVFYALVDIVIRFFDTDLSVLIRLSVIEVKRKEVVTVTSVRYSGKTLKTSNINDIIILVRRMVEAKSREYFHSSK